MSVAFCKVIKTIPSGKQKKERKRKGSQAYSAKPKSWLYILFSQRSPSRPLTALWEEEKPPSVHILVGKKSRKPKHMYTHHFFSELFNIFTTTAVTSVSQRSKYWHLLSFLLVFFFTFLAPVWTSWMEHHAVHPALDHPWGVARWTGSPISLV